MYKMVKWYKMVKIKITTEVENLFFFFYDTERKNK